MGKGHDTGAAAGILQATIVVSDGWLKDRGRTKGGRMDIANWYVGTKGERAYG